MSLRERPIAVVGVHNSGTSIVEQVISEQPGVDAGIRRDGGIRLLEKVPKCQAGALGKRPMNFNRRGGTDILKRAYECKNMDVVFVHRNPREVLASSLRRKSLCNCGVACGVRTFAFTKHEFVYREARSIVKMNRLRKRFIQKHPDRSYVTSIEEFSKNPNIILNQLGFGNYNINRRPSKNIPKESRHGERRVSQIRAGLNPEMGNTSKYADMSNSDRKLIDKVLKSVGLL